MVTVALQYSVFLMGTVTLNFTVPYGHNHTSFFSVPIVTHSAPYRPFAVVMNVSSPRTMSIEIYLTCCRQKYNYLFGCEILIHFNVVSLVKHTLLPAVLPLLVNFLESSLWNHVQLCFRFPHIIFS